MPLSLQSRQIGAITVVKCSGRLAEGADSAALQQHLADQVPPARHLILDLGGVTFIDSSGLGLLVRLLTRARAAGGDLKLCLVSSKIREVMEVTKLRTVFESYESEIAAIAAFYQREKSAGTLYRFNIDILCVEQSADVLAYVRELLGQAGFGVITANNLADALTLLQATRPKVVVIGADLNQAKGTRTAETFYALTRTIAVIQLSQAFSGLDAGEAGHHLLDQVRAAIA